MPKEKLYLPESAKDSSNRITYHDRTQRMMKTRGVAIRRWARASWLVDATTPKKNLCDRLGEEFKAKSRSVLMDLGTKFQATRCREDREDVRSHSRKLAHLQKQLSTLGHTVSNDEHTTVSMGSLSPCYDGPHDSFLPSFDICETRAFKTKEEAPIAAGTKKPKCWARGSEEIGGGPKKSKDDETRGTKDTGNAAETKESSGDDPGAAIVKVDDVPSKGANCRPKKYGVQVRESRGGEDKSQAEEGEDSASSVETETSCEDESRAATVEVDAVPSGESWRSQSALNVEASLTEVRSNARDQEGEDKSKAKAGKDVMNAMEPGTCSGGNPRVVVVEVNNAPSQGEHYVVQASALIAGVVLTNSESFFSILGGFSRFLVLSIVPLPSAHACTLRRRV